MVPAYPQPQQPQQPQHTDGKAIASLVCGVAALVGCLALTGIPAIILGFMARGAIKRSQGTRGGDGLAIAGIVTGFVSLLFTILAGLVMVPLFVGGVHGYQKAQIDIATSSTRTIESAAELYRISNPTTCPTVTQLKADGDLSSSSSTTDPWGMPYEIECTGSTITVTSYGPDKTKGTSDDVRYSGGSTGI